MIAVPPSWLIPFALAVWLLMAGLWRVEDAAGDRSGPGGGRVQAIDGLRGILALMVYCHHFAITRQFQASQSWALTPSRYWNLSGQVAVAIFFMVTGFLFIQRIRRWTGIRDIVPFGWGRVVRIMPVYWVAVALVALVAFATRDTGQPVDAGRTLAGLVRWLEFKTSPLFGAPDPGRMIAYVSWSLQYELLFYAVLPAFAGLWALLGRRIWPILVLTAIAIEFVAMPLVIPVLKLNTTFFAPFLMGGCVALIGRDGAAATHLRGLPGLALCGAALVTLFATQTTGYGVVAYGLATAVFAPIALGNDLLGCLRHRGAQVLGLVSYDIYLMHGLVLYVGYTLIAPHALETDSTVLLAFNLGGAGAIAILISVALHLAVEGPAQRFGARALSAWGFGQAPEPVAPPKGHEAPPVGVKV